MGNDPIECMFRQQEYKPIGSQPEDFIEEKMINNSKDVLTEFKSLEKFKKKLWEGIGPRIRPNAWRILFKYIPLNKNNELTILQEKRKEYQEFKETNREEKFEQENDVNILELLKVIRKDIVRTLPDSHLFRHPEIQNAMTRILIIYSVRHPSNYYSQGMNDILAPIFCIFVAEKFEMTYIQLENNIRKVEEKITEESLLDAEADAFHCFSLFLSTIKQNYIKGFDGIYANLKRLNDLILKSDKELHKHFEENDVEIFHFAFRWCFCLLFRELPLNLSTKLMDFYLTEDSSQDELCLYLMLALVLKFSTRLKELKKEQIIIFLQRLPTGSWGDQDIHLLVSEAFVLKNMFKLDE